jgi:hypothetical protein
VGLADSNPELR